ncbi:MAG: T9SS type A sorting domain-containing protein, partial [Ignavibacteriae bacterium]|nr:T9SS type A sorting domain-containing protein [Ignavibacteriota bacterium]
FRRMPKKGNSGYTSSWSLNNLPAGTYYWSVQTVDNEYAGSVFTAEQSFVISPTGVPGEEELPERITLVQNYPNPFNPSTVISYRLSVHSSVSLTVYNLLGEEITTLVNETQDAGFKSVEWNVSGLPSGVYVARLIVGNTVQTKAMLLMK